MFYGSESHEINHHEQAPFFGEYVWVTFSIVNHHEQPPFFGYVFFLELVPSIKASNSRKCKMRTQDPKITPLLEFLGQKLLRTRRFGGYRREDCGDGIYATAVDEGPGRFVLEV